MVKHDLKAQIVVDFTSNAVHTIGKHIPLIRRKLRPAALTGLFHQFRHAAVVVRQHDIRRAERRQQPAHLHGVLFTGFMRGAIYQPNWHERRQQFETALVEFFA